jgi:hypothetical protein
MLTTDRPLWHWVLPIMKDARRKQYVTVAQDARSSLGLGVSWNHFPGYVALQWGRWDVYVWTGITVNLPLWYRMYGRALVTIHPSEWGLSFRWSRRPPLLDAFVRTIDLGPIEITWHYPALEGDACPIG